MDNEVIFVRSLGVCDDLRLSFLWNYFVINFIEEVEVIVCSLFFVLNNFVIVFLCF